MIKIVGFNKITVEIKKTTKQSNEIAGKNLIFHMAGSAFGTIVGKAGKVLVTDILSTAYDFLT